MDSHVKTHMTDGKGFDLKLGGLSTFYGGLEALIGPPNPNVLSGMRFEHTGAADTTEPFPMPNKKTHSTSEIEWLYVEAGKGPIVQNAFRIGTV